ncbi:MAG: hypothetical protein Q8O40_11045 [Chloroflexota bacterium]|nr:hypothetical protein [Chloroflexota bacterium]
MTYLALNLLLLAFPLAYWLARRTVPWRAWALLVALGLAFDLLEYNIIRIWTAGPGPTFLGMPAGEYAFILGLPLRAIAIYELVSVGLGQLQLFGRLQRPR